MLTRRELLQGGLVAGAGLLIKPRPSITRTRHRRHGAFTRLWAQRAPDPSATPLTPYVDRLSIPPVVRPAAREVLQIPMLQFKRKLHRDLPPTTLWGYRATSPGPTIEVRRGTPLDVEWTNRLPTSHFLPIDNTIHGAEPGTPPARAVVHLHGAKVLPEDDGHPEAWFTSDGQTGPYYNPKPYHYPNDQAATTLWYHDHALGITRLNLYAGLKGFYIIRDDAEGSLNLPKGNFEIPLMIHDAMFNPDGSLLYPTAEGGTHPAWIPEFFGDTMLVNGKAWPYLEVEPRKYRFRILNACNARFLRLTLMESDESGNSKGSPGPPFNQIGTDGGLLAHPVRLNTLTMPNTSRADVVIDFSDLMGKVFVLLNDAPAPFPDGDDYVIPNVMLFKVNRPLSGPDRSSLPSDLVPLSVLDPGSAVRVRQLTLTEIDRESDGFPVIALLDQKRWHDPVTEDPKLGSVEVWELINTTEDAHSIHLHVVQFQILNRQPFDVDAYLSSGTLTFTGPPVPPAPNEAPPSGHDIVNTLPGSVNRIVARFDLPAGTPVHSGQRFGFVWHCHISEHEDNEMMRPYEIVVA